VSLQEWLSELAENCKAANPNYGPKCLNLDINYTPERGSRKDCKVKDQNPGIGEEVTTRTRVTLDVRCDTKDHSDEEDNKDGLEPGGNATRTGGRPLDERKESRDSGGRSGENGQTDKTTTTDQPDQ
jgi:hypothetical protein